MERQRRYIELSNRIRCRNNPEERGKRRIEGRQQGAEEGNKGSKVSNKALRKETGKEQGRLWVLYRSQNESLNGPERTRTERPR